MMKIKNFLIFLALLASALARADSYINLIRYFWATGKYDEARTLLLQLAENDDLWAQYNLGISYLDHSPTDYRKAYHWLSEAASQNDVAAQFWVGWMQEHGMGVEKDVKRAAENYEKAAGSVPTGTFGKLSKWDKRWKTRAQYRLGMLSMASGDYPTALKWLTASAKQKSDSAQFQLGLMYEEGLGVVRDYRKAAKYYRLAAKKRHLSHLAASEPDKKGSVHIGLAIDTWRHREALYRYGLMCKDGRIGLHDYYFARSYMEKAASQGHPLAQMELALLLKRRQGPWTNRKAAVTWLQKAAQQGVTEAQYQLAGMLERGQGVAQKDSAEALRLYQHAAQQGHELARMVLAERQGTVPDTLDLTPQADSTPKRMALLIANEVYPNDTLKTPRNDAYALKAKLRELGFETWLFTNLRQRAMTDSIVSFCRKALGCEVALFFFAGHGSQDLADSYLRPAYSWGTVPGRDVQLSQVLNQMQGCDNQHNIVIIDACRVLSRNGGTPVATGVPSGFFLSLSTAMDNVAADGPAQQHSPYAEALLQALDEPGLTIEQVFSQVKRQVERQTANSQPPNNINCLVNSSSLILNNKSK